MARHMQLWHAIGAISMAIGLCGQDLQATPLEIGKTYEGGTVIEADAYGLDFTVPEGWSGLLPPGGTFFAMTPDNRTLIFATAEPGGHRDAQASLIQPLPLGNGIKLEPIGVPRVEGDSFIIDYAVQGSSEPFGSQGRAVVGKHGVIAGFIGVAPKDDVPKMLEVLSQVVAGAHFAAPPSVE